MGPSQPIHGTVLSPPPQFDPRRISIDKEHKTVWSPYYNYCNSNINNCKFSILIGRL